MSHTRLTISDSGYVYGRKRSNRGMKVRCEAERRLGHISELLRERTSRGELVRDWWTSYLADVDRQFSSVAAIRAPKGGFTHGNRAISFFHI